MLDVTLIWQKSWKVTQVASKCNVHLSSMPDNGTLSSTHLPVSEVNRSRANGGVTLVGNPDWEGKVKHWRKKPDKWWRREMGFWSQTTNDQTLFSTSAPVAEGSESNIHQDFSSAHEDFFSSSLKDDKLPLGQPVEENCFRCDKVAVNSREPEEK